MSIQGTAVQPLSEGFAYLDLVWSVLALHTPDVYGGCSCGKPGCDKPGKHPRYHRDDLAHGAHSATRDREVLRRWLDRWPNANIGISTGAASGVWVLDSDGEQGNASLTALFREHGKLPHTLCQVTGGGGMQIFFEHAEGLKNAVGFAPGLDVRTDGGLVVLPPSLHASGKRYAWLKGAAPGDLSVAVAPEWLLTIIRAAGGSTRARTVVEGSRIIKTTRNDTLFRMGCALRHHGSGATGIRAALEQENQARCDPPLDEDEVNEIVASCLRYQPGVGTNGTKAPERADSEAPSATQPATSNSAAEPAEPVPIVRRSLAEVTSVFEEWLYLPNDWHIKAALGAYFANVLAGDPVWLMLIAGPGSGKTEIINALPGLPDVHLRSSLSGEAALLSATPRKDKAHTANGGLLQQVGRFGVLALKDFTSVLGMNVNVRSPLLAALREVYDGYWSRQVGVDGGRLIEWRGKLGIIAGCTPTIDTHHGVIATMGERFLFCRVPPVSPDEQADRAVRDSGQEVEMRVALAAAVAGLFERGEQLRSIDPLNDQERAQMVGLATAASLCRSAVERDGYHRDIVNIPDRESPARIAKALTQLLIGMLTIGVGRAEGWQIIGKIAIDSMPKLRWECLKLAWFSDAGNGITTSEFAEETHYPATTVRRSLEDLHAHGMLSRESRGQGFADVWRMRPEFTAALERLKGILPDV